MTEEKNVLLAKELGKCDLVEQKYFDVTCLTSAKQERRKLLSPCGISKVKWEVEFLAPPQ